MRFSITWPEFALCCLFFIITGGVIGQHLGQMKTERRIFFNELQGKNNEIGLGKYKCIASW